MADFEDLRRIARVLPHVEELTQWGEPWFNVGKKTFALSSRGRAVLKLDKAHQHFLFEVRSETFQPCRVATGAWSYVALDQLDEAELTALVREAWSMVVPKRISKPYLAALTAAA
jgi:hypothetical protein